MLAKKLIIYKTLNTVKYKTGPHNLAMKFQGWSGLWVTSSITNEELVHDCKNKSDARLNKRNELGKSSKFTYLEAKAMHKRVKSGVSSLNKEAILIGVDQKTAKRAYENYEDVGVNGFMFFE